MRLEKKKRKELPLPRAGYIYSERTNVDERGGEKYIDTEPGERKRGRERERKKKEKKTRERTRGDGSERLSEMEKQEARSNGPRGGSKVCIRKVGFNAFRTFYAFQFLKLSKRAAARTAAAPAGRKENSCARARKAKMFSDSLRAHVLLSHTSDLYFSIFRDSGSSYTAIVVSSKTPQIVLIIS